MQEVNKIVKLIVKLDEKHTDPRKKSFQRALKRQEKLLDKLHGRLGLLQPLSSKEDLASLGESLLRQGVYNRTKRVGRVTQNPISRNLRRRFTGGKLCLT